MRVTKDLHVHEYHSADAQGATVEGYCRAAEEKGIDEVCFTTHLIVTGADVVVSIPPDRIGEYIEGIEAARAATSVKLGIGLEVDYFPEEEKRIAFILNEYSFDFILGSMHYVRGYDIGDTEGSKAFFRSRSLLEALDDYYHDWRIAVESGLFDVMAHPDYFRKFLPLTHSKLPPFKDYGTAVLKAVDRLKSYSVGIEVNSSGYKYGLEDCFPSLDFLKAVKQAGIETVTIGSDSHSYRSLGAQLEHAVARLREVGYTQISTFSNRKSMQVNLDKIQR